MTEKKSYKKIRKILQAHDIAATPQRLAVGKAFFDAPTHLSADQVMSQVKANGNPVSKATVYNTLRLFIDRDLLREVNVDRERLYYDSRTDPHHHIYNADTGELIDVEKDDLKIASMPDLPSGTEPESIEVVIQVRNRR